MLSEREDIVRTTFDILASQDAERFYDVAERYTKRSITPYGREQVSVHPTDLKRIAAALGDELAKRGQHIISEIVRIFEGAQIEDFDALRQKLHELCTENLYAATQKANAVLKDRHALTRSYGSTFPIENLGDQLSSAKAKALLEIDLFCIRLKESQRVHLSLQAGEVFAGNRAARKIFTSATKSLDIIDTYLGPEVFDMLEVTAPSVQIRLLSNRCKVATRQAYFAFQGQCGRIEFRQIQGQLHDRFIIIDSQRCITPGHSIKDLGTKMTVINEIPAAPMVQEFCRLWTQGTAV